MTSKLNYYILNSSMYMAVSQTNLDFWELQKSQTLMKKSNTFEKMPSVENSDCKLHI